MKARTKTMHGPALGVIVQSVLDGMPLLPGDYTPDRMLPTPDARQGKAGIDPGRGGRPNSGGEDLKTTVAGLFSARSGYLPTPTTQDRLGPALTSEPDELDPPGEQIALDMDADPDDFTMDRDPEAVDWGPFSRGIALWALVLDREPPHPVEPGPNGQRLSPRFVEWLMGLPGGWVTDVAGSSYRQQLGALGNAVVPQQAVAALTHLGLSWPPTTG